MSDVNVGKAVRYAVIGAVGLFAAIVASCSPSGVDNGNTGLEMRFGKIVSEPLPPGLYFVNPLTTKIVEINTQVQKKDGVTQAYTKDVQQANVAYTLNYALDPRAVPQVYREVGLNWEDKLIGQVIVEEIKRAFGQYEAVPLINQRDEAARSIEAGVTKGLASRNVIVTSFRLTNIDYSPEFEKAVEAKVVAQQEAIREQNNTVRVKEQASQAVETARGLADSTVLQAKAEAESIKIKGQALRENSNLVDLVTAEKWDGKLPTQMIPGSTVPFIHLGK